MIRNLLVVICCFLANESYAQTGTPFAVWEDQSTGTYWMVSIDGTTGMKTNHAIIPGMSAFVAGNKTCYNSDEDHYHFAGLDGGQQKYYTYQASMFALVSSPDLSYNIIGIEYHCGDSSYYGLREQGGMYDLVIFDPIFATVSAITPITGIDAYVSNTFFLDRMNGYYGFQALDGGSYYLNVYDVKTGMLVQSNLFPDNLTGYKYNCTDSSLYGLWENGSNYQLERIDHMTGVHSTVAVLTGVSPGIIPESSSVNDAGIYTYRGFDSSNNISVISIDLVTGTVTNIVNTNDNATGFEESICCYDTTTSVSLTELENFRSKAEGFPNPSNGHISFDFGIYGKDIFVNILNGLGEVVHSGELFSNGAFDIYLKDLGPGMYTLIAADSSGRIWTGRFILQ